MKCDEARDLLANTLGLAQHLALRLHLLRCPDCRAEAAQLRTLHAALGHLPRFGPPPELLSTLLAQAQAVAQNVKTRKEIKPMKRLVFVAVLLIVIGLLAGGLLTRHAPPDGRSLLIGVAEAMEQAKTIYVRGRPNVSNIGDPPWGRLGEGYYENWYSPEGSRHDLHDAEGNLLYSSIMNVASGVACFWQAPSHWFPSGVATTYSVGTEDLRLSVRSARETYLNGELRIARLIDEGRAFTTREGVWNGTEVTVVEVDHGITSSGLPRGTGEFYLDPRTGHLLGLRQYGPETHGKPLTADMQIAEYGIDIPASTFDLDAPAGTVMLEDDFEIRERGNYCLQTPASFSGPWKITPAQAWHASASTSASPTKPGSAIDGNPETCWTGRGGQYPQEPGMWFQLDFDTPVRVSKLRVEHVPFHSRGEGWPRGLQISATCDGVTWEDIYTGQADSDLPAYGHLGASPEILGLRFDLTEYSDEEPWTISEIKLYGRPQ